MKKLFTLNPQNKGNYGDRTHLSPHLSIKNIRFGGNIAPKSLYKSLVLQITVLELLFKAYYYLLELIISFLEHLKLQQSIGHLLLALVPDHHGRTLTDNVGHGDGLVADLETDEVQNVDGLLLKVAHLLQLRVDLGLDGHATLGLALLLPVSFPTEVGVGTG